MTAKPLRRALKWSSSGTRRELRMCVGGKSSRADEYARQRKKFLGLSHDANSPDGWKREVFMFGLPLIPVVAGLAIIAVLFGMALLARMFRKAGPHEALIIYGLRGTRIVKGGGTIIFPMIEQCRELSLELMSFDVAPQQSLYTKQGVAVTIEAVAQIKEIGRAHV